ALRLGARFEADIGPREAKVIELFGVDLGELLGVKRGAQVPDRGGRRFGRVIPTAERHDQDGPAKTLWTGAHFQSVHRVSVIGALRDGGRGSLGRTAD